MSVIRFLSVVTTALSSVLDDEYNFILVIQQYLTICKYNAFYGVTAILQEISLLSEFCHIVI